jgi:hypothetical protein
MPTRTALTSRRSRSDDLIAIPPGLALTAQRQDGVVTRRQLRDAMVTLHRVENWIAARRWRAIGRNVVVLQNSPLTNRQREWAAVLLPEKPAALAGLSAAAAAGLQGFEPDKVHVVVAHDTHGGFPPWAKVHESRRFQPEDIAAGSAPPRTRTPRSIIDAATWSKWPRRACAILCAAVQQRLATADQLANELRVAGHVRHVAIMRNILGDIAGGGHTLAEINLGPLARRAGYYSRGGSGCAASPAERSAGSMQSSTCRTAPSSWSRSTALYICNPSRGGTTPIARTRLSSGVSRFCGSRPS